MIRALHTAASIATHAIDLIGTRRAAIAAARAAASVAGTLLSVGRVLDESTVLPMPSRLSPAEIELLNAAVAIPDDGQIRSAENPVPAVQDAFRATIRLIEAAAALRAERSAARRGIVK